MEKPNQNNASENPKKPTCLMSETRHRKHHCTNDGHKGEIATKLAISPLDYRFFSLAAKHKIKTCA
jgi:hypothetical protein